MKSVREWRFHIGAHKTATSHLQANLAIWRTDLATQGVDFIPREDFRAARVRSDRGRWRERFGGIGMRWQLLRDIAPLRLGPGRIVISEENLIGLSRNLLERDLYSTSFARLEFINSLPERVSVKVFLSIRSFDTILPSAYVQSLRTDSRIASVRIFPDGFDPLRAQVLAHPPSWTDLVERLQRLLPRAKIRVWAFEDYLRDPRTVMAAFCGVPMPATELPAPATPNSTRSPSAKAVADIEALDRDIPPIAFAEAVQSIIETDLAYTGGTEPYQPFTPDERVFLKEVYAKDLAALDQAFPGSRIRVA